MRRRRPSLRVRLIAISVVVAAASIATTAWITTTSTSASIQEQYAQNVSADATIYDALLGYAATHTGWSGVGSRVTALAAKAGRRITVTTIGRTVLADSASPGSRLAANARPAATVNPLAPDAALTRAALIDGVDARAVGPFALTSDDVRRIKAAATRQAACLGNNYGVSASVAALPNRRSYVLTRPAEFIDVDGLCDEPDLNFATATEQAAAAALLHKAAPCLAKHGIDLQVVSRDKTTPAGSVPPLAPTTFIDVVSPTFQQQLDDVVGTGERKGCVEDARRAVLIKYVAPPALVFISGSVATQPERGLSRQGLRRIVAASTVILLLTVLVCVAAASGLIRPLRALTTAAERTARGERPAQLRQSRTRELATLASSFNFMSSQLDVAEQRRKDMISDVAHELRTPLGNIRGWLEAIQDGIASAEPELVASLLDESRLLQSIIDDLQDLALLDADRMPIHPETIDAGDAVAQVATIHQATAAAKGLAFETRTRGDLVLHADPARLRQMLGNIVANAVRYTDRGRVELRATATEGGVCFVVTDTGVGIDAQDLPHVFDRFWRAEKSRSRRSGGSGLGLAITQHLVQAHAGQIDVRSEVGVGTTVTVHLPRRG
ncbi:MAG: HAMP domain-containing sensor histidine kinase [Pseudonocardiales bacterium]